MEKELKTIARKSTISCAVFGTITSIIILMMILITIFVHMFATTSKTSTFYFTTTLCICMLPIIISTIYTIRKLRLIKKSHFTYGKIIKIEKDTPGSSDVYQNFIIEYIDEGTNKKC